MNKLLATSSSFALQRHCVFTLGGIAYYARSRVESTLTCHDVDGQRPSPAIVFNVGKRSIDVNLLEEVFSRFDATDDVFTRNFITGSVLIAQNVHPDYQQSTLPDPVQAFLESYESKLCVSEDQTNYVPEGPYMLQGRDLHQVWRLYEDDLRVFTTTVFPDESGPYQFQPLRVGAYTGLYPVAAVPSRLYSPPDPAKPLSGLRISIKDNLSLHGIKDTLGSRSYTKCYGAQESTAVIVQRLVDEGAVIVGKTVMSAWAGSEVPPEKTIDYFAPWNPRGDGYQGPSGSSSGAGASAAGYDWVDIALATDTTGSTRMPAASYGLWGLRASWDSFSLEGIYPSVSAFDALGVLTRKPHVMSDFLDTLMPTDTESTLNVGEIIYPTDWFPMGNEAQQAMQEDFLRALETYTGVKHTAISISSEWKKTGPEHLRDQDLIKYLAKSSFWPNHYDGYHSYDKFIAEYEEKFGEKVYASPFSMARWQRGIETTKEERDQGLAEIEVFRQWMEEYILVPGKGTVILLPLGRPGENYRDIVPPQGPTSITSAYNSGFFASVLGLPQLVIPIGQNPYQSRVSGNTEYAPIVASLAGCRGSDRFLLSIAEGAVRKAGWPTEVFTGRNIFPLGDNSRNTATDLTEIDSRL